MPYIYKGTFTPPSQIHRIYTKYTPNVTPKIHQLYFDMDKEIIYGQIIAKANHYMAVPGNGGLRRIIKDDTIRKYERSFTEQCILYKNKHINERFKLHVTVWHSSIRFDLDNSLKTLLDCLQTVNAITDDNLCFGIDAEKRLDKSNPRIEFWIEPINEQKNLF